VGGVVAALTTRTSHTAEHLGSRDLREGGREGRREGGREGGEEGGREGERGQHLAAAVDQQQEEYRKEVK
jgi:hypothetical protein